LDAVKPVFIQFHNFTINYSR